MVLADSGAPRLVERAIIAYCLFFFAFFPLSGPLRGGSLPKLVIASAIGVGAIDVIVRWARPRIGTGELVFLSYGAWYVLAIAAAPYPLLANRTLITVIGWPIVLVAMAQLLCTNGRVRAALFGYMVGCAATAAWALFNMATGVTATAQIVGQDTNDTGFFTSTGAVVAIAVWSGRGTSWRARILSAGCAAVSAVAVVASLSRGSLLGMVLGVALIFLLDGYARWQLIKGAVVAAVVAVMASPLWLPTYLGGQKIKSHVAGENVSSRLDAWTIGANLGFDRPLSGIGPSSIAPYIMKAEHTPPGAFVVQVAHNTVIEALYGTGVAGALLFLSGVALTVREAWRSMRASGGRPVANGRAASPALAALAAAIVCAMFTTQIFNPTVWVVFALGLAGSARPLPARLVTFPRLRRRPLAGVQNESA